MPKTDVDPESFAGRFKGSFDLDPVDAADMELDQEFMVVATVRLDAATTRFDPRKGTVTWSAALDIRQAHPVLDPDMALVIYEQLGLQPDPKLPFPPSSPPVATVSPPVPAHAAASMDTEVELQPDEATVPPEPLPEDDDEAPEAAAPTPVPAGPYGHDPLLAEFWGESRE